VNKVIDFATALQTFIPDESFDMEEAIGRAIDRGSLDPVDMLVDEVDSLSDFVFSIEKSVKDIGDSLEEAESHIKSLNAMFDALANAYRELNVRIEKLESQNDQ